MHVPIGDQVRRRKGNGADVITVDQCDQDRPDQHPDLKRAQPAFVEQTRNLDVLAGHRFPRKIFLRRECARGAGG